VKKPNLHVPIELIGNGLFAPARQEPQRTPQNNGQTRADAKMGAGAGAKVEAKAKTLELQRWLDIFQWHGGPPRN
jgi:hypothetical protein